MNTIAGAVAGQAAGARKYLNSPSRAFREKDGNTHRVTAQPKPKFVATSQEETEFWEDVT
jgi:hypothetical protein